MPMIPVVASPNKKVAEEVINAVAVRLFSTLTNSSFTPFSNTRASCSAALNPLITRIPPRVSVSLPFTSALIFPLALKMGLIILKAFKAITAKMAKGMSVNKVMETLICSNSIKETTAVMAPPTNCTKPVPIKFLTPSTSVMILETKAPDLVLSKNLMGNPSIFFVPVSLTLQLGIGLEPKEFLSIKKR